MSYLSNLSDVKVHPIKPFHESNYPLHCTYDILQCHDAIIRYINWIFLSFAAIQIIVAFSDVSQSCFVPLILGYEEIYPEYPLIYEDTMLKMEAIIRVRYSSMIFYLFNSN